MKKSTGIAISLAAAFAGGIVIGALVAFSVSGSPWRNAGTLTVPDVRQSTTYSCGAASLQAVLAYWGVDKREGDLMTLLGSKETSGTGLDKIIAVAESLGLKAGYRENLTLRDLRNSLDRGVPVIVAIQAWTDAPAAGFDWKNDWEDGHYVVVIGVDDEKVYVEDPSLLGSAGFIPKDEFTARWHDYSGEPPLDRTDRKWTGLGIFIEGKKAAVFDRFARVE